MGLQDLKDEITRLGNLHPDMSNENISDIWECIERNYNLHGMRDMLLQRVGVICLGYIDLNEDKAKEKAKK